MVYIGLPSNPQFLGRQEPDDVAKVIAMSVGPSGRNSEYLFMLEDALGGLGEGSGDGHVEDLAGRVRALLNEGTGSNLGEREVEGNGVIGRDDRDGDVADIAVDKEIERIRSGEGGKADEEAEKAG